MQVSKLIRHINEHVNTQNKACAYQGKTFRFQMLKQTKSYVIVRRTRNRTSQIRNDTTFPQSCPSNNQVKLTPNDDLTAPPHAA
jgi:hypothetical protein